jgi:23S rRNA pseudouridine2605 synthase
VTVGPADEVSVDGKPLVKRQRTRLFLFHKPRGLVTTNKDPEGRPTIFDHLHQHAAEAPRLISVGRLDINTEGLLLLTNDGGLARVLELPSTGWLRRYRVRANGETDQAALDALARGVTIEGVRYAGIEATLDRQQGANCWLTMGLREGKNREIKRVLQHLGLTVNRLIRISFGPFQLGELGEGRIEEVRTRVLRDQLGAALALAAGVDFDSPLEIATPEERASSRAPHIHPRPRRAVLEPEPEKIRSRPRPGPRKHISALRSDERARESEGPRRRLETGKIADRKGRAVAIERYSEAKRPEKKVAREKPGLAEKRAPRQKFGTPKSPPGTTRIKSAGERPGAKPRASQPRAPQPGGKGRRPK